MDKSAAIEKVKLLLRLASNTSSNEASAAKAMADKLIEKYALLEEEYTAKEAKPIYTEDNVLFEEKIPTDWKAQLAIICGNKFDCYIIQEKSVGVITGDTTFKFFIYGHKNDIALTKALFEYLTLKVESLIIDNCEHQSELYKSSYAEGLIVGARGNIEHENFNMPGITNVDKEESKEGSSGQAIEKTKEPKKEKPIEETTEVNAKEKPLDIYAYFIGEQDGADYLHLNEYMAENKLPPKKQETNKSILGKIFNFMLPPEKDDYEEDNE